MKWIEARKSRLQEPAGIDQEVIIATSSHKTGAPLSENTGSTGPAADLREHMEVYASCGTKIGKVDHVQGDQIKLTKNDSPDSHHHLIPMSWVAKVPDHFHLSKDHKEVQSQWQPA